MAERAVRIALGLLVVQGLVVGAWAAAGPRSFYDDFPGGGRAWVAADGPYNEHLVRDFGDLNLALGVVTLVALLTMSRAVVLAAALGWVVYQAPHLVYHLRHLDVYDTSDKVASRCAGRGSPAGHRARQPTPPALAAPRHDVLHEEGPGPRPCRRLSRKGPRSHNRRSERRIPLWRRLRATDPKAVVGAVVAVAGAETVPAGVGRGGAAAGASAWP